MSRNAGALTHSIIRSTKKDYICPSCCLRRQSDVFSTRKAPASLRKSIQTSTRPPRTAGHKASLKPHQSQRNSSHGSLISSTAINSPSQTSKQHQPLRDSLLKLQEDAAAFVDFSKLQLITKSLESGHPTIRIGFLTLGERGAIAARRLAKVLLSDALGEEQDWEEELTKGNTNERSLLLRYGQLDDLAPANTVAKTINIPSNYLQKHRLEILITPYRSAFQAASAKDIEAALLVPSLTIPASAGRVGFVRNPVHKSVVIAAGVHGAIQLGQLNLPEDNSLITAVIDLPAGGKIDQEVRTNTCTVDINLADEALQTFRQDPASGGSFGHDWLASRITTISEWIASASGTTGATNTINEYTSNLLVSVEESISEASIEQTKRNQSLTIPDNVRNTLQKAISEWSAEAHNDLRNNLITALDSRAWRRTTWYRLLWRIDDVSYSSTDILNQYWLNETEQRLAFLSGRIREAGLASDSDLKEDAGLKRVFEATTQASLRARQAYANNNPIHAELVQLPTMLSRLHEQSGVNPLFDPPWPQTINLARQLMLHTNVPDMHRMAQGLVLSTLSTIGGTSALGVWLWFASSGSGLYEAGAIVALGLVWSLRRLQRLWSSERDSFATIIQENGRQVLIEIEQQLRRLVQSGGRSSSGAVELEATTRAKAAVSRCYDALRRLKG